MSFIPITRKEMHKRHSDMHIQLDEFHRLRRELELELEQIEKRTKVAKALQQSVWNLDCEDAYDEDAKFLAITDYDYTNTSPSMASWVRDVILVEKPKMFKVQGQLARRFTHFEWCSSKYRQAVEDEMANYVYAETDGARIFTRK